MQSIRAAAALLAVLTGLAARPAALAQDTRPAAADLASRVQARYTTIRNFTADFTLTQTGGLVMRAATDRGTVAISKPGRMRWTFVTGSKNEVVSDGVKIYSYFPQDKYVQVTSMPKTEEASTALLLLTGRGDLTRDFEASTPADPTPGEWLLTLKPKVRQADFTTLTLAVDRTSLQLRGLGIVDTQGSTQVFRFTNLRENQGIKDTVFEFRIPRGVEIR